MITVTHDNHEDSRRYFAEAYKDPEKAGEFLPCRQLVSEFVFTLNDDVYIISPGFWWDGASIPKALWSVIGGPWEEDIAPGALIHDVLYGAHLFPRDECDEIMKVVNKGNKMSAWKVSLVHTGLRWGGASAYRNKTPEQIAGVRRHLSKNGKALVL
jgi:hypothetical protein